MHDAEITAHLEACHTSGYCWALACCGRDPAEAEEVLQTVYLKILEGRARFRGESSFRTWLFALIRRTAADRRRRQVLRRVLALRLAEAGDAPAPAEHPDDALRRAETGRVFRRALATLPRRQREALELVFYHDMSVEEAAAVMRVTVGAARQHYDRGKRRLRQVLEESEVSYVSDWRGRENPGEVS
jgi:RNA polymerase sigma-70 factor (ECF subfamily)